MRGKRGTPQCWQCQSTLKGDLNLRLYDRGLRDSEKWEEDPCIDLKETLGDIMISTVFLHHDHSFGGESDPIFYETMIFQGASSDYLGQEIYCKRYHSKKEAITKHNIIVTFLKDKPEEEFFAWIKLIREEYAA